MFRLLAGLRNPNYSQLAGREELFERGEAAYLDWTTDPVWMDASFTARGALIYNAS